MWYYESKRDDSEVIAKLNELAEKLPHREIDEYYGRLRLEGYKWNRKRVLRVYRLMNLQHRRKRKRRLPARVKEPLETPEQLNHTWSMDFMHDVLENSRKVRILNIIDDYNREAIAQEVAYCQNSESVIRTLENLIMERDEPLRIRTDNGPEFISKVFQKWCSENDITNSYTQPDKPTRNAYIERFNRTYREDVLDAYLFENIE